MTARWEEYAAPLEREDAELLRRAALARMAMPVHECADCEDECDCVLSDAAARPEWRGESDE